MRITHFIGEACALLAVLVAAGCGSDAADPPAAASKTPGPSAFVVVTPVESTTIERTLAAYGTVEYAPEGAGVVSVQADAVVMRVTVAVGQSVRRGEALMTLEPSASARTALDKARIDLEFANREARRLIDLRQRELATNAEVEAANKAAASQNAAFASLNRLEWNGGSHVVRADVVGTVRSVDVQPGQLVAPGAPLLTIGSANSTRVRLGVEQDEVRQLKVGQPVRVEPLNSADAPIASHLAQVYRTVDPKTRLTEAMIPLPPGHGLLPGAFVRAAIVVAEHPHALVVPHSAVLYTQDKPHVFVDEHGHAQERKVELGIDDGKRFEVTRGLVDGDTVISGGNAELKDGMAIRTDKSP